MEIAGALAVSEFAELDIVHPWGAIGECAMRRRALTSHLDDEGSAYVEQLRRHPARLRKGPIRGAGANLRFDGTDYLSPQLSLSKDSPRRTTPALAKCLQGGCIAMGTAAGGGVRSFIIGDTTQTNLAQIHMAAPALKPPEFVPPAALAG